MRSLYKIIYMYNIVRLISNKNIIIEIIQNAYTIFTELKYTLGYFTSTELSICYSEEQKCSKRMSIQNIKQVK